MVNAAATAMERAGECATLAIVGLEQGYPTALNDAFWLVYGPMVDEASQKARPVDQSACPRPPCPAMLLAIESSVTTVTAFTGSLSIELLGALVLTVRRLAELEQKSPAAVVADLVARTDGSG